MMSIHARRGVRTALAVLVSVILAGVVKGLTVEKIPLERLTRESGVIVRGVVMTTGGRWEGNNIYTVTTVRVTDRLKGTVGETITVTQLGGTVGEVSAEVPGTPVLRAGEDVVLFLTPWQGKYWIHSIVLGRFAVVAANGTETVVNDLRNIGLVDPATGVEITDGSEKEQRIPLHPFLERVRAIVAEESR
jgi:hypothetical protein